MKQENSDTTKKGLDTTIAVAIGIILVVFGIVAYVIFTIANPLEIRKQKMDQMKLSDFEQIKYTIQTYYEKNKSLPDSLNVSDLNLDSQTKQKIVDFGYTYEAVNPEKFKLCTIFETDTKNSEGNNSKQVEYYYGSAKHIKGYDCIYYVVTDPKSTYTYIDVAPESR